VRLFFAIELSGDVRAALGRLVPKEPDQTYRWADPAGLHITLAFLGEQPEAQLPALVQIGALAASSSQPGSLQLGQAGSFGGSRATPRVLWIGLAGDLDRLGGLQQQLDRQLRQAGFVLDDRPFRPHITLARHRPQAGPGRAVAWPPPHADHARIPLQELTLFESRLSPRGATYVALHRWPLGSG